MLSQVFLWWRRQMYFRLKLPGDFLSPCGKLEDDVFGPMRSEKASEPAGRWRAHTQTLNVTGLSGVDIEN